MMKVKTILLAVLIFAAFLRLWKISEVPVSLFGDELDVGYHAYSVLKTGRDYYGNFMPLHFHSLAEWRTPLYLYSAVPTVFLFGISPLGVRLPAAIFGVAGVWGLYLLVKELTKEEKISLLSAFLLAISPWHIQYSRAGFEVTQLLTFLLFGIYFFIKSLRESKYLWVAIMFLTFTPWIYSTAKLFTPLLLLFLFVVWRRDIFKMPQKEMIKGVIAGVIVGVPIAYSTIFGGGAQRAKYTSVFTDPTIEPEIGHARMVDNLMRDDLALGYKPEFSDRLFHNKFTFWGGAIIRNYLQSVSTGFLFVEGDPNLRHSIKGMGQFYKIEIVTLILGLIFFFTSKFKKDVKILIVFWLVAGALPSALTRDGGNHATRLILILPPLIFLISYGVVDIYSRLKGMVRIIILAFYLLALTISFIFYQHNYWVHYPWDSERWWHSGFEEGIQTIKEVEKDYDRVIISNAGEPAWIFFAAWFEYPPEKWQKEFPIGNDVLIDGFGVVSHTDKYFFGTFNVQGESLYDLSKHIDARTLYLAVAKEIGTNLIMEPQGTPAGLKLVKAIPYPSGEPAFYLFAKN
jgi:4-amino-4-deoxy-L-arabinose transferase-like glycosyltransferase